MLCIDYHEACQRKNRSNSWNDCHSRVEVPRQQAQKKMCWDFAHALLELAVWLQASGRGAGEDRAIAAGSKADKKSGCRCRLPSPTCYLLAIDVLARAQRSASAISAAKRPNGTRRKDERRPFLYFEARGGLRRRFLGVCCALGDIFAWPGLQLPTGAI
jgi:hypothetical protein